MERVLIKEKSKELLKVRWLNAIGALLIFSITSSILGFIAKSIPIIGIIISFFLTSYISLSFNNYFIKITETDKKVKYMDCFIDLLTFFKTIIANIIVNAVIIIFLITIIILAITYSNNQVIGVIIFSLCLVTIGLFIYCYLTFFTLFYIFREDKEIGIIDGIKKSMSISKGFKCEYLIFLLSFIGWYILSFITFGIGFLWSVPYFLLARFLFYKNMLKRK